MRLVLLVVQVPQVQLDLLDQPVHKEQQVLQEILVRLGLQARQELPVQQDPQVLQAQRAIREQLAQQDLKVLQETRERLDRLVR